MENHYKTKRSQKWRITTKRRDLKKWNENEDLARDDLARDEKRRNSDLGPQKTSIMLALLASFELVDCQFLVGGLPVSSCWIFCLVSWWIVCFLSFLSYLVVVAATVAILVAAPVAIQ